MVYQSHDLIEAMRKDANLELTQLKVDGGASVNNWLMLTSSSAGSVAASFFAGRGTG